MKVLALLLCLISLALSIDFGSVIGSVTNTVGSTTSTVTDTINSLTSAATNIIDSTKKTLTTVSGEFISQTKSTYGKLTNQTLNIIDTAKSELTQTSKSIMNTTQSLMTETMSTIQSQYNQLQTTVKGTIDDAVNLIDDKIKEVSDFINNFSNQMCQTECVSFFNLPCFVLFRCNDKLKKLGIFLLVTILLLVVLCFGCSTGLLSPVCICKCLFSCCRTPCIFTSKQQQKEKDHKEQIGTPGGKQQIPDQYQAQTEKQMVPKVDEQIINNAPLEYTPSPSN